MIPASLGNILQNHPDVVSIHKLKRPGIVIEEHKDGKKEVLIYNIDYKKDNPYQMRILIAYHLLHTNNITDIINILDNHIQNAKYSMHKQFGYDTTLFFSEPVEAIHMAAYEFTFTAFSKAKSESVIRLGEFYC
jgi:hypothetical protein